MKKPVCSPRPIVYFLFLTVLTFCKANERREDGNQQQLEPKFYKKYEYKISEGFGFVLSLEAEPGDGVNALSFNHEFVFLSDAVHMDVKRIDIQTGKVLTKKLDFTPYDVQVCNDQLFVMGRDSIVQRMDLALNPTARCSIEFGEKYFLKPTDDALPVYFLNTRRLFYVDCNRMDVKPTANDGRKQITGLGNTRDRKYSIEHTDNGDIVATDFGRLKLRTPFDDVYRHYNAINIDFTDDMLVHYGINEERFFVEIYRY